MCAHNIISIICFNFQICHKGEKTKYKNAKDLLRHMPRLVKVTGTGKEFPSDVKQGDLIQILGEVTEGNTTYLRWVDNEMKMKVRYQKNSNCDMIIVHISIQNTP